MQGLKFEVSILPLLIDGEVVGFPEFVRDITEHKRVQKALRENEENCTELFELHPVINLLTAIIASVVNKLLDLMLVQALRTGHSVFRRGLFLSSWISAQPHAAETRTVVPSSSHLSDTEVSTLELLPAISSAP